jgi:heme-degrading monooxygenase HmoA
MPYVMGTLKVEDFDTWYSGFSSPDATATRKAAGTKSHQIFQTEDDPNHIGILLEWDTLDNARRYFGSEKFQEAQKSVKVLGQPEMYFLKEVEKKPYG